MHAGKQVIRDAFSQLSKVWKVFLILYTSIIFFFFLLQRISGSSDTITLSYFTRDISAIGNLPFFAGLVSQIGGLLWATTLAICLFTFFVLRAGNEFEKPASRFLLQASILTGVLLLDDFFRFHEDIGPDYLSISEKAITLIYLLLTAGFLFSNAREILASEYLILAAALGLFGLSIFLDAIDLHEYYQYGFFFSEQFQIFLEDGLKFLGVATWLAYFTRYAYQKIILRRSWLT